MKAELEGELAVVTGGASGIGAAIVRSFAESGARVASVDMIGGNHLDHNISAWRCDVTNPTEVESICNRIKTELGDPSILVNNVGGSGNATGYLVEDISDETWDLILALNIGSAFRFCRAFVPAMKAGRRGKIVNVSSSTINGMFGSAGTVGARLPYVTAKSALVGFTKQMAKDLGPFGILVNTVAPGFTLPDDEARITKRFRALPEEQQHRVTSGIPLGRPGTGVDMANAIGFLVSPRNTYVSGQIVFVDGGGWRRFFVEAQGGIVDVEEVRRALLRYNLRNRSLSRK